jgi:hypothetical protein
VSNSWFISNNTYRNHTLIFNKSEKGKNKYLQYHVGIKYSSWKCNSKHVMHVMQETDMSFVTHHLTILYKM